MSILALAVFTLIFSGRARTQETELSPEEIIQILQDNPDVLAEAKQEIVTQLRDRGYNISVNDITDDRLFSQIRSDERVQQIASNFLIQHGFGPQQQEGEQPLIPLDQQTGAGQQTTGQPGAQPSPTPPGRATG